MAEEVIAKRYAQSLLSITDDIEQLSKFRSELVVVEECFQKIPNLKNLVNNPGISEEIKRNIFKTAFSNNLSKEIYNFVQMILKRRRIYILPIIIREYKIGIDKLIGDHFAEFVTAIPLSKEKQDLIVKRIENFTGYRLDPEFSVDPEIIGGIFIKIDDVAIDGRLSRHLLELKRILNNNKLLFSKKGK